MPESIFIPPLFDPEAVALSDVDYFRQKMFKALAVPPKMFGVDLAAGSDHTVVSMTAVQAGKTVTLADMDKAFEIIQKQNMQAWNDKEFPMVRAQFPQEFNSSFQAVDIPPTGYGRTQLAGVYATWKMYTAIQDHHHMIAAGFATKDTPPKLTDKGLATLKRYGIPLKGEADGEES